MFCIIAGGMETMTARQQDRALKRQTQHMNFDVPLPINCKRG